VTSLGHPAHVVETRCNDRSQLRRSRVVITAGG
jgi:hypothetical protein